MLFLFLAAIPCVMAPVESTDLCKDSVRQEELETIPAPGVTIGVRGAGTASATRAPWVDSNGWRFLRKPTGKYVYELPKGKAALAAAEGFAYGADVRLRIAPEDVKPASAMLSFLNALSSAPKL